MARAGHEVHFLLRSDYETVRRQGVRILSPLGDFQVQPLCARIPGEIGQSELVLIGLKTTANAQFRSLLPPLVGHNTLVVTLQNGLGNEEQLARLFPAEQILGCLCFVCLNRLEPGLIRHSDHGQVVLGEFGRPPSARTESLASVLREASIRCRLTDNLARTHWEKLVWNIPFNGLGVAAAAGLEAFEAQNTPCLNASSRETFPTDRLLRDPGWSALLRELMLEVIHTANALHLEISEALADTQLALTRSMGAYKASTLIDFERRFPLELESLFLEPLRQACQAGVPTPRLQRLCEILEQLDTPPTTPGI